MSRILVLACIFCFGNVGGWVLELFYRRFFSNVNGKKQWINPGFLNGPWLPIYGFGLCMLYLMAGIPLPMIEAEWLRRLILFACMAIGMTLIELVAGIFSLDVLHVKLWDYSDQRFHYRGIICPKFSFYWSLLGAAYYFGVHPFILDALQWISENLAFTFFFGMFYGVLAVDVCYSVRLVSKLRAYAIDHALAIRYEELKASIQAFEQRQRHKVYFFFAFHSSSPLSENIRRYWEERTSDERFRNLRRFKKKHKDEENEA